MSDMNLRKYASIAFITLLVMQAFVPGALATYDSPSPKETATESKNKTYRFDTVSRRKQREGENVVEVVSLSWKDVNRLIKETSNVTIDGWGSKSAYEQYKEMDEAGISMTPGSNRTQDQFLVNNQGEPMLLYDLINHRVKNPDNLPYLSRMVSDGFISYTTAVDKTTRVCPEYPDENCEAGHPSQETVNELTKSLEGARDTLGDKIEEVGEGNFKEVTNTLNDLKDQIEHKNETKSPLNTIQSNRTTSQLSHADKIFMFPLHLSRFISFLEGLSGFEQFYSIAEIASIAVGIADLSAGLKGGKLLSKGMSLLDSGAELKHTDDVVDAVKGAMKSSDGLGESTKVKTASKTLGDECDGGWVARITKVDGKPKRIFGSSKEDLAKLVEKNKGNFKNIEKFEKTADGKWMMKVDYGDWTDVKKFDSFSEVKKSGLIEGLGRGADYNGVKTADEINEVMKEEMGKIEEIKKTVKDVEKGDATDADFRSALRKAYKSDDGWEGIKLNADPENILETSGQIQKYQGLTSVSAKADELAATADAAEGWKWVKALAKSKILGWGVRTIRGAKGIILLDKGMLALTFAGMAWGRQPTPGLQLATLNIDAKPERAIEGKESYFEIARTAKYMKGRDYYPSNLISNMVNWFIPALSEVVGGETDSEIIRDKISRSAGPGVVMAIDQETPAPSREKGQPTNVIVPTTINGEEKWTFRSINPEQTDYYALEHPKSYATGNGKKFTTMVFMVKNLDMGGVTRVSQDWANFGWGRLFELTPTTQEMVGQAFIGGSLMGFSSAATGGKWIVAKALAAMATTKGLGWVLGGQMGRVSEPKYGPVSDVSQAYSENKTLCSKELSDVKSDIKWMAAFMTVTKAAEIGTDTAGIAMEAGVIAASGGTAAPAIVAAQIGATVANYYTARQYQKKKRKGLERMKNCQETEFTVLAYQKMKQGKQREKDLAQQIEGKLGKALKGIPGLDSISPEARKSIAEIGRQGVFLSTMRINGKIEGKSLVNLQGTEMYQVHFDREADIKWFLEQNQKIEFCRQTDEGKYLCMKKRGYLLLNETGGVILEAPNVDGMRWDNDRQLLTIPQKVINVKESTEKEPVMDIRQDSVDVKLRELSDTIRDLTGTSDISNAFGELQTIKTENAMIWKSGDATVVRLLSDLGTGKGRGTTLRLKDTKIRLYRNEEVAVVSDQQNINVLNETFSLGESGYLSFENGKMMPGGGETQEIMVDGEKEERDFSRWMHIIIYNLMEFEGDEVPDWWTGLSKNESGDITGFNIGPGTVANELITQLENYQFEEIEVDNPDEEYGTITKSGNTLNIDVPGLPNSREVEETSIRVVKGDAGTPAIQLYNTETGEKINGKLTLLGATGLRGGREIEVENPHWTENNKIKILKDGETEKIVEIDDNFWTSQRASHIANKMDLSQFEGENGEKIRVKNETVYIKRPGEPMKEYKIEGMDEETGRVQLENGKQISIEKGEDGQPEMKILGKNGQTLSTVPLLRGFGKGGTMGYEDGKISLNNEFPLKLNPKFGQVGAGMTNPGMITPKQSPWGGRSEPTETPGVDETEKEGIMAQLPSTPKKPIALTIFIITILGGAIAIRTKNKENQ